jgi:hypothetical protein
LARAWVGLPAASENVAFVSPIHQLIFLIGSASSPTLSNLSLWLLLLIASIPALSS